MTAAKDSLSERILEVTMTLDKSSSEVYHDNLQAALIQFDPEVHKLIAKEYERLQDTIQLLAAENQCSRAALAALGSILQNKTSEGFPAARLHGGSGRKFSTAMDALIRPRK